MEWVKGFSRYALVIREFLVEDLTFNHWKQSLDEVEVLSKLVRVNLLFRVAHTALVVRQAPQLRLADQLISSKAIRCLHLFSCGTRRLLHIDESLLFRLLLRGRH